MSTSFLRPRRNVLLACLLVLAAAFFAAACDREGTAAARDLKLARDAYSGGCFLEAEAAYERYLEADPDGRHRLEAWSRAADICSGVMGDPRKAVSLLEAGTSEYAERPGRGYPLLFRLGGLYERLGWRKRAVTAWNRCLKAAGDDSGRVFSARMRMALADRALGRQDLAVALLTRCAGEAPDAASRGRALYVLAETYSLAQNWGGTVAVLQKLLRLPDVPPQTKIMGTFLLADTCAAEKNIPKARELFISLKTTYPNPAVITERLNTLGRDDHMLASAAIRPSDPDPGRIPSAKVKLRRVRAGG